MENQEIRVTFSPDDYTGDYFQRPDTSWTAPDQKKLAVESAPKTQSTKDALAASFGYQIARTGVTTIIGRIGSYTGDYMTQNAINNVSTGINMIAAAATLNPIVIGMAAFQTMVQVADYQASVAKANQESLGLQNLVGTFTRGGVRRL